MRQSSYYMMGEMAVKIFNKNPSYQCILPALVRKGSQNR